MAGEQSTGFDVRSYRRVYRLDQRMYTLWGKPLPFPNGLPLRGALYGIGLLVIVLALHALGLLNWLSATLKFFGLPVLGAVLGCTNTPDGRQPHRYATQWAAGAIRRRATQLAKARRDRARRALSRPVVLRQEASGAGRREMQHARIAGTGSAKFAQPVQLTRRRRKLIATPATDGTSSTSVTAVVLDGAQPLEIRP